GFVVARRLKYRQPVYLADREHLHHRFVRTGFSQRRAAVYIWGWCLTLAAAALATRFIPFHKHGRWHPGAAAVTRAIGLAAPAAGPARPDGSRRRGPRARAPDLPDRGLAARRLGPRGGALGRGRAARPRPRTSQIRDG